MKTVFYFMLAFVALIFLFSGVLQNDINLNQELHGMVVGVAEQAVVDQSEVQEDVITPMTEEEMLKAAAENPDLIVVYPYG